MSDNHPKEKSKIKTGTKTPKKPLPQRLKKSFQAKLSKFNSNPVSKSILSKTRTKLKPSTALLLILLLTLTIFGVAKRLTTSAYAPDEFVTTWKTDNPGVSNDDQITIFTDGNDSLVYSYNYNIDWGDGSADTSQTGNITHTYASPGTYTVKIKGTFPRIYFGRKSGDVRDKDKLLTVEQWGSYGWSSMRYAFWDCTNLEINANDAPDLSYVTDMRYMFTDISSINSNISGWDVSHVRQFDYLFLGLSSFNQPLNNWDMSNATSIDGMFWDASSFNQPLDNWTFPNVTSTYSMFLGASSFNQDISGWDVSNLTVTYGMFQYADAFNQDLSSWDVSNVTNMSWMFDGTKNFNQPLDAWETSSLTNTRGMFYRAEAFNQPLGAWDVSNLTQAAEMFGNQYWSSTNLSYKNYDLTIKGWAAQPLQSYGRIDTGYVLGYCTAVAERAYMISTYNWTFNDGGSVCPSLSTTGSRVFTESSSDDGSIENTVTIISEVNSDFSDATFVEGTHYTATNIPAGLSLSVSRVDSGSLTVSLIGNATYHEDSDDVPGIAITFLDPAFVDIPASFIQNNPLSGFSIDFIQPTSPPHQHLSLQLLHR